MTGGGNRCKRRHGACGKHFPANRTGYKGNKRTDRRIETVRTVSPFPLFFPLYARLGQKRAAYFHGKTQKEFLRHSIPYLRNRHKNSPIIKKLLQERFSFLQEFLSFYLLNFNYDRFLFRHTHFSDRLWETARFSEVENRPFLSRRELQFFFP